MLSSFASVAGRAASRTRAALGARQVAAAGAVPAVAIGGSKRISTAVKAAVVPNSVVARRRSTSSSSCGTWEGAVGGRMRLSTTAGEEKEEEQQQQQPGEQEQGHGDVTESSTKGEVEEAAAPTAARGAGKEAPADPSGRRKHRRPQKRASKMLATLQQECVEEAEQQRVERNVVWPKYNTGDALEIWMKTHMSALRPSPVRGVVLGTSRKGLATTVLLLDYLYNTKVERRVPVYSPLISEVKVLQKSFIHRGKKLGKRVRRSKIYYIRDLDPSFYKVSPR